MNNKQIKKIIIYTDGACSGNPGKGGYAAVIKYNDRTKTISGYSKLTTNNRMEITAALAALTELKEACCVELYTDSSYLIGGITKWAEKWQKTGWKNAAKQSVKNKDLWKKLIDQNLRHKVEWRKVKGHSGDKYNEICDNLAKEQIANGV